MVTLYPKRSTLFSIGLERKKKEKNDFKRLQNMRKARKYWRNEPRELENIINITCITDNIINNLILLVLLFSFFVV